MNNVSALSLPFEEAISFFRAKANVTTKKWTDVCTAAHSRAFMVAGAAAEALVADFRGAIDKAISQGTTLDEFRKDFDNIVARHGWSGWTGEGSEKGRAWRQEIIYDTNLRTAYSAGRYAQMTDPDVLEFFPYWQYNHSGSLHPRLNHLAWDGLVLKADDPFWNSNYPPNGWRCGCYAGSVSESGLARRGKTKPDPSPKLEWTERSAGGKTARAPAGVDMGFEYSPGQAWLSRTAPGAQTVAAAPGIIERFAEAAFAEAVPPQTYIPAAVAPKPVAELFDLPPQMEIRLSADTIRRHRKHTLTTAEIYSLLPEYAISEGDFFLDEKQRIAVFAKFEEVLWQIGLKKTRAGEIYITTIHRARENKYTGFKKQGYLLKKGK